VDLLDRIDELIAILERPGRPDVAGFPWSTG
jgi:hypothetical protein